jgi:hypothetical protein
MRKKTLYFVCVLLCLAQTLLAQDHIEVPVEVKLQFLDDFISAKNTTWLTDSTGNYKADFAHQSQVKTVFYKKDGTWLYTETELFGSQVPSLIHESLANAFKVYDIEQIRKRETKQSSSFQFKIRSKNALYGVEIDSAGKIKTKRKIYEFRDHDY